METSGLDPEITICKIAVLPIKLCPLIIVVFIIRIKYGVFILTVSAYFGTVLYIENKSNKSKKAKAYINKLSERGLEPLRCYINEA